MKKIFLIGTLSAFIFGDELTEQTVDKHQYVVIGNFMFQDNKLPERMNWQSAIKYCNNLNYANYSDWRLPTRDEFKTAYNDGYRDKFKNGRDGWYWSSTVDEEDDSLSWRVSFFDGGDGMSLEQWYLYSVRCVR